VAEIERENIIEQTMNGRKEKARQGPLIDFLTFPLNFLRPLLLDLKP
jgi:DNA invertase Pin-like site-specific DNA recombinase